MKKLLFCILLLSYIVWDRSYYGYVEDIEGEKEVFEKKFFSMRTEFYDVFSMRDTDKRLDELDVDERQAVIDFCKYRLGIITKLASQEELEQCKLVRPQLPSKYPYTYPPQ